MTDLWQAIYFPQVDFARQLCSRFWCRLPIETGSPVIRRRQG